MNAVDGKSKAIIFIAGLPGFIISLQVILQILLAKIGLVYVNASMLH